MGHLMTLGVSAPDAFLALDLIYGMVLDHGADQAVAEGDLPAAQLEATFGPDLGPLIRESLVEPETMFGRRLAVLIAGVAATAGID